MKEHVFTNRRTGIMTKRLDRWFSHNGPKIITNTKVINTKNKKYSSIKKFNKSSSSYILIFDKMVGELKLKNANVIIGIKKSHLPRHDYIAKHGLEVDSLSRSDHSLQSSNVCSKYNSSPENSPKPIIKRNKSYESNITITQKEVDQQKNSWSFIQCSYKFTSSFSTRSYDKTYTKPICLQSDPCAKQYLENYYTKGVFELSDKVQEIMLKDETVVVVEKYKRLVPSIITYDEFWSRYFYRCSPQIVQQIMKM